MKTVFQQYADRQPLARVAAVHTSAVLSKQFLLQKHQALPLPTRQTVAVEPSLLESNATCPVITRVAACCARVTVGTHRDVTVQAGVPRATETGVVPYTRLVLAHGPLRASIVPAVRLLHLTVHATVSCDKGLWFSHEDTRSQPPTYGQVSVSTHRAARRVLRADRRCWYTGLSRTPLSRALRPPWSSCCWGTRNRWWPPPGSGRSWPDTERTGLGRCPSSGRLSLFDGFRRNSFERREQYHPLTSTVLLVRRSGLVGEGAGRTGLAVLETVGRGLPGVTVAGALQTRHQTSGGVSPVPAHGSPWGNGGMNLVGLCSDRNLGYMGYTSAVSLQRMSQLGNALNKTFEHKHLGTSLVSMLSTSPTLQSKPLEMLERRALKGGHWLPIADTFRRGSMTALATHDQDLYLDLPIIVIPVYWESNALDYAATEAGGRKLLTCTTFSSSSLGLLSMIDTFMLTLTAEHRCVNTLFRLEDTIGDYRCWCPRAFLFATECLYWLTVGKPKKPKNTKIIKDDAIIPVLSSADLEMASGLVAKFVRRHHGDVFKLSDRDGGPLWYEGDPHITGSIRRVDAAPGVVEVDDVTLLSVHEFNDVALRTAQ
uniref:Uncharacterized protein n=1 Tax=Timema monikensis TaxID=170555 RepID=A0A7R9E5H8_9NEOP|nr:unnamed protein product [Timema monikensis]